MSFRELRDFTEVMRFLGYPRIVSVENFRTPNFALVADALYWMVNRYDPHARLSDEITTQNDRVKFITRIVQIMSGRAQLKLNAKRLYAADGRAVRELLKLANLLMKAKKENIAIQETKKKKLRGDLNVESKDSEVVVGENNESDAALVDAQLPALHNMRALANEITESGAKLYDLLQHEEKLCKKRENALQFLDATNNSQNSNEQEFLERKVQDLIASQEESIAAMKKQCEDLEHDEKVLSKKIKKKKTEVERGEKRLSSLQKVRPAFMDELEKLQGEMKQTYEVYLERYRNLDYLEKQLDLHNQAEKENLESAKRNLRRMQQRLRKQGEQLDRGTDAIDTAFNKRGNSNNNNKMNTVSESGSDDDSDDDDLSSIGSSDSKDWDMGGSGSDIGKRNKNGKGREVFSDSSDSESDDDDDSAPLSRTGRLHGDLSDDDDDSEDLSGDSDDSF